MAKLSGIAQENELLRKRISDRKRWIKRAINFIEKALRKHGNAQVTSDRRTRNFLRVGGLLLKMETRSTEKGETTLFEVFSTGWLSGPSFSFESCKPSGSGPTYDETGGEIFWSKSELAWLPALEKLMRPGQLERELRKAKRAAQHDEGRKEKETAEASANEKLRIEAQRLGLQVD